MTEMFLGNLVVDDASARRNIGKRSGVVSQYGLTEAPQPHVMHGPAIGVMMRARA